MKKMKTDRKDRDPISSEPWFMMMITFFVLSFLLTTFLVVSEVTQTWDRGVTRSLSDSLDSNGKTIFRFITSFGGYMFLVPATIGVVILSMLKKYRKRALFFPLMMLSSLPLYRGMKWLSHRPRPDFALIDVAGYSYPSGHATVSFTFFLGFYLLFYLQKTDQPFIYLLPFLMPPVLIGLSRVFLAVHYPTDIIGGFLLGAILITAFYGLYDSMGKGSKGQPEGSVLSSFR